MSTLEANIRNTKTSGELKLIRQQGNVPGIVYGGSEKNQNVSVSIKVLKEKGAKEIHVYITHGVLSGDAVNKIRKSTIKNLVITDTIDNYNKIKNAKNIEILSVSNLMGEAIRRISNSTSVSFLFK